MSTRAGLPVRLTSKKKFTLGLRHAFIARIGPSTIPTKGKVPSFCGGCLRMSKLCVISSSGMHSRTLRGTCRVISLVLTGHPSIGRCVIDGKYRIVVVKRRRRIYSLPRCTRVYGAPRGVIF